jgi:hypothetical protein
MCKKNRYTRAYICVCVYYILYIIYVNINNVHKTLEENNTMAFIMKMYMCII